MLYPDMATTASDFYSFHLSMNGNGNESTSSINSISTKWTQQYYESLFSYYKTNTLEPVVYQGSQWLHFHQQLKKNPDFCEVSVPIIILAIRTSHKTPLAASQ